MTRFQSPYYTIYGTIDKILTHLVLQYLRTHAGVDADEDNPAFLLRIGDDESPAPLSDVDARGVLLGLGVAHLQTQEDRKGERERDP